MMIDKLFRIDLPLIQAPMAGVQDHQLAVAVSNAGGLGSLPAGMLSPQALAQELEALTSGTRKPYNVNFFCHRMPQTDLSLDPGWLDALLPYFGEMKLDVSTLEGGASRQPFNEDSLDILSKFRPPVVSFHFGLPDENLLAQLRGWGAKILSSATTVDEAIYLEKQGVDAIIAQGLEAGGHRGSFLADDLNTQMGTVALLPQVRRAVNIPVIAAGGIADSDTVSAAFKMGASGVQIGTAYLLCHEATTTEIHRAALKNHHAHETALTNLFSGKPARGIVNRLMHELGPMSAIAPAFPYASVAVSALRWKAEAQGSGDFSPLWSGQNNSGCREVAAADMTRDLMAGLVPGQMDSVRGTDL